MMTALAAAACALAAVPAVLFLRNLAVYRAAPPAPKDFKPPVSLLIPARNEERSIAAAVEAALASRGVELEVVVLDDHSEDGTAAIVEAIAARDGRVRLLRGPPLPEGWCGKQHACAVLATAARHPLVAFVDADVRLTPDGLARLAWFLEASRTDLVSGVPRQETGSFLERLVLPLIHFILLGFLPMWRMRRSTRPAYAAGCGQLFLARRVAYEKAGGHAAIRVSLHDGLMLPRAFRRAGMRTDLCDATDLAVCRMYRRAAQLWQGLTKNATEGLGNPAVILPMTVLLLGGQVMPVALLAAAAWLPQNAGLLAAAGTLLLYLPRLVGMRLFRQSVLGAVLHPLGVVMLLTIQWHGLLRKVLGRPASWKGRQYNSAPSATFSLFL
jgi:hypothetical protein